MSAPHRRNSLPRVARAGTAAGLLLLAASTGHAADDVEDASAAEVPPTHAGAAAAEPRQALPLSLEDALQRSLKQNEEVTLAAEDVRAARGQELRARSDFFPQVTLSASYERTLASEFDDVFNAPAAPANGDIGLEELPFGRRNAYRASVNVTQNVFAGGRTLAQTRSASALTRQAVIGLRSAAADVDLATVEAYYDAALSDRFVEIAAEAVAQAEATLNQVRLSRREGQDSQFELLRAQVALENERPNLVARRMQQRLAHLRLRQRLGLPDEQPLILTSKLRGEGSPPPLTSRPPSSERAPVRQAVHAIEAADADVTAARSAYYPNVNLAMTYGRVSYPDDLTPDLADLRTNWTIGLYLAWPIFEGLRTRGQVQVAEAALGRARARYSQVRKLARFETEQALQELEAARAVFEATAGSIEQARQAYSIAELRYREGISTQLELSDARLLLTRAETNSAQAARDLEVARARVRLLPDLPLSAAIPVSVPAVSSAAAQPAAAAAQPAGAAAPATSPTRDGAPRATGF